MRIVVVSQEYPPETAKGGIGTQAHAKAHGLAALGHEMFVISRSPDGRPSERLDGSVRVIRIAGWEKRMPLHTEVADWVTYSAAVGEALSVLHNLKPIDLVEFPEWAAEGYVHLINRTEWNHIPTVIQLHSPLVMFGRAIGWPDINSEFFRTGTHLESTAVRLADAIYSSSQCSLDWCAKHYGRDPAGVPVLHTGIDTGLFHPMEVEKASQPTIVFAGKLEANKGIFTLLEAALSLAGEVSGLRLRLLGRGTDDIVAALKERAADAGLPAVLDLAGFVEHGRLPEELSRAHVFSAPSSYEARPVFVNLEAMACGLPVVTTTGSGGAEVVMHEKTGLLIPPENAAALTDGLRRLLMDSELRHRLGRNARTYAEDVASRHLCIARIEAFFRSVVAGTHGQHRSPGGSS